MKASVGIGAATALALAALIPLNQASIQHPARTAHHQAAAAPVDAQLTAYSSITAQSSFAWCVIQRESGGNPQALSPAGYWGLYQFSRATWQAYGGNPATYGRASAAEQTRVFNNAIAHGGKGNWAPYDGC